jgi:hypothetical protein
VNGQRGDAIPPRPIAGNANAVDGEVRRLDDLKERLWSTGEALRNLTIESWRGPASDAFEDVRHAVAHQWLTVGDLHEDAARALERYHQTLMEVQGRARTADLADPSTAQADLNRWRQQLDSDGEAAATAIRRAARALAALPRLLSDPRPTPVAGSPPAPSDPAVTPMPPVQAQLAGLDPRAAAADPAAFRQRVRALSAEVLSARIVVISPI